jgi:hypothetical protein
MEAVSTAVLPAAGTATELLGAAAGWLGAVALGAVPVGDGARRLSPLAWASALRVRPPGAQVGVGIKVGDGAARPRVMRPGTAAVRSGVEPGPAWDGGWCL